VGVPPGTPDDDQPAWQRHAERWNRMVAQSFLSWLAPPPGITWLNVNCGNGVLAREIAARASPSRVWATDPSEEMLRRARQGTDALRVSFHGADITALPFPPGTFDRTICGLGWTACSETMLAQLRRVLRPGGEAAFWLWDRAGGMQPRHHFLVAAGLPVAEALSPAGMTTAMARLGFGGVAMRGIDIPVLFQDFDAYWALFQDGEEPEATYCRSLDETARDALRARLREESGARTDGSIAMIARAWGIRGIAR
jgi:SAM-dependent methyltransferase